MYSLSIAKPATVVASSHLSISLTAERILKLPGAIGGVSINLRPQEPQHLPAFCLELIGLPRVVDPLTDRGMEF